VTGKKKVFVLLR